MTPCFKTLPFQMTHFNAENTEHIFSVENQVEYFFYNHIVMLCLELKGIRSFTVPCVYCVQSLKAAAVSQLCCGIFQFTALNFNGQY